MAPKGTRRGVLMTASARKPRGSWRAEPDEDDQDSDAGSGGEALAAKASQVEWEQITREVREDRRKRHAETEFAMGRRDDIAGYGDVAEDAVEPGRPPLSPSPDGEDPAALVDEAAAEQHSPPPSCPEEPRSSGAVSQATGDASRNAEAVPAAAGAAETAGTQAAAPASAAEAERELPPEGAITAGQTEDGAARRKRGGKKKTGSQKKRERAEVEADADGGGDKPWKKRRNKDEDEDDGKWLKLKLDGEEKTKRIKAARVVSYHDFDSGGALFRAEPELPTSGGAPGVAASASASTAVRPVPEAAPAAAATGNFRGGLRWDLWGDDDDSEE